ncbi:hypothetical protein [Bradyrhizobium sp. JYMT SZCCT0428]|uniref:hypothetical protein n=1 Tax=Bradyrhizobium sp. JYMT SZCCT0428 TaxID=2807673 RepID=UPI001BA8DDD9|nr:hypothetical protein [Bradyrhizobium sp. JYMT SZCCT0428]MBR1157040.1 hypothetical protein [Bradyrhizobium sp. JYMT SZCCT0428]
MIGSSTGEQGNGHSTFSSISADGRYVTYDSSASSLVDGDTNGMVDVFHFDRQRDTTERVSVSSTGEQGNNASQFSSIGRRALRGLLKLCLQPCR